jgi:hypothetical protein
MSSEGHLPTLPGAWNVRVATRRRRFIVCHPALYPSPTLQHLAYIMRSIQSGDRKQ